MSVTFDYYRVFYHVAKYQSFTRAAKLLMSSQPNVTRAIGKLEDELGCRLFVRSNKGVTLTPEGEKLFKHVQIAYRHLRQAENEISDSRGLREGHLSIGVSESALHGLMLPVLRDFHQEYPGVRIQITNSPSPNAIEALRQGMVELAVITTPADVCPPLAKTRLKSFRDIPIAGHAFAKQRDRIVSLGDIARYPIVSLARGTSTHLLYSRLFAERHLIWEPDIEVATAAQVLPVVRHNLGIGFVPPFMAQEAIENGDVFRLNVSEQLPPRHICLIRDRSHPESLAVQELMKKLKAAADEDEGA